MPLLRLMPAPVTTTMRLLCRTDAEIRSRPCCIESRSGCSDDESSWRSIVCIIEGLDLPCGPNGLEASFLSLPFLNASAEDEPISGACLDKVWAGQGQRPSGRARVYKLSMVWQEKSDAPLSGRAPVPGRPRPWPTAPRPDGWHDDWAGASASQTARQQSPRPHGPTGRMFQAKVLPWQGGRYQQKTEPETGRGPLPPEQSRPDNGRQNGPRQRVSVVAWAVDPSIQRLRSLRFPVPDSAGGPAEGQGARARGGRALNRSALTALTRSRPLTDWLHGPVASSVT